MHYDKVFDNELVDKFDAEDTIFNNCMTNFREFPEYITHYDDIKDHIPQNNVTCIQKFEFGHSSGKNKQKSCQY